MTMSRIYGKLRKSGKGQYLLLGFCSFLSVLLITSFALMYFGPTVQNFLSEGGDTRKMAVLLFAVTAIGCFIFTVYASNLFFRYKSREYGIFMALGLPKKSLGKLLFRELSLITAVSSLLGLICSMPVSYLIWKIFELFIVSTEQMSYRFGPAGFIPGIVFSIALALMLCLAGKRFVKKSNIMDILRTQHKSEMAKEIKPWTFPAGMVLIAVGIVLGSGLPRVVASVFSVNLPGIINVVYLLSVIGIYMVLLSIVSQSRLKKNKSKYYKNLVSVSLMRFTAKATTRNMCVIVLLIFVCCFSSFYGMQYSLAPEMTKEEGGKDFSMHSPALENQITGEDIYKTADKYNMDITEFAESSAANLIISYHSTDMTEDGSRYIEKYDDGKRGALFMSSSDFEAVSGKEADIKPGTYKTVTPVDYKENFFDKIDGLDKIKNPDSQESMDIKFDGTLEFSAFYSMSTPFAYVISDSDYEKMTKGLSDVYRENLVFFNVADVENSYDFAKDLLAQYVGRATEMSNHLSNWDLWEERQTEASGEEYGYSGTIDMTMENSLLLSDWKYSPGFNIIMIQDQMQLISVYVMLCLYIFIIALAAISVMTYVRSISIAADNRQLFDSLKKLGADRQYQIKILKKQLARIFQYPAIIGCSTGFAFSLIMDLFNDGRLAATEITALTVLMGIIIMISGVLFAVYKYSLKKAINKGCI